MKSTVPFQVPLVATDSFCSHPHIRASRHIPCNRRRVLPFFRALLGAGGWKLAAYLRLSIYGIIIAWFRQRMRNLILKTAIAVVLLIVVLCIFIAPSIDLEPCALRAFQFIALFALLFAFPISVQVCLVRSGDDFAGELRDLGPLPAPLPALEASCIQLC
jgi:hypothetical protein